ncbi:nickel-binding protein [Haloarchaeobius sp. DFWS5]|uniref:nickel-binding protein n=1 Tax=Haloarchaeobius sp. DFWS5 TaxID=3446114 RepID=UPI003EB8DC5E
MTEEALVDFLILRILDEPVTHAERERASERSIAAAETARESGVGIDWVRSEIMTNEDDEVTGTVCHFKAESEDAIRDHADCAGIPVTRIERRSTPVDGPYRSANS